MTQTDEKESDWTVCIGYRIKVRAKDRSEAYDRAVEAAMARPHREMGILSSMREDPAPPWSTRRRRLHEG